jgi:hypothetical protein
MQYSVWPHIERGIKFFIIEKIKNILLYLLNENNAIIIVKSSVIGTLLL